MTAHYGEFDQNTVVYMPFTSVANGNSVASSLANGNVVIYKDGSNANSVEGISLNVDWPNTGYNLVTVNTAANTTRYSTGSFFRVAVNNGNVAGTSAAGYGIGTFTIRGNATYQAVTVNGTLTLGAISVGGSATLQQLTITNGLTSNIAGNMTGSVGSVNATVNANAVNVADKSGYAIGTGGIDAAALTAAAKNAIADSLLDRANAIEASITVRQAMQVVLAASGGNISITNNANITVTGGAVATNRITAVGDAGGNRSAVVFNV